MEVRECEQEQEQQQQQEQEQERTIGLEERFASIEEILDHMEQPDATLEQSFALYQQGLRELKAANEMLDEMEKSMLVMAEDGSLEEF